MAIDNRDLRLRNIKDVDLLYYRHRIFIEWFQHAKSLKEVARRTRMSVHSVCCKAAKLRGAGIPLKKFKLDSADHERLAHVARALSPKKSLFEEQEERVVLWQKSRSVTVFAKKAGVSISHACSWAAKLRGHGVPLKYFQAKASTSAAQRKALRRAIRATPVNGR